MSDKTRSAAPGSLQNAKVYRGWRYVVYQRGRAWDVECDPPGTRCAPTWSGSQWRAWTAARAERRFKKYVDEDIARRVEYDERHRLLYGTPTNLFPPTEEELRVT